PNGLSGVLVVMVTTAPGDLMGSGRSRSASAKLKIAVFAPMPKARETAAIAVNPGFFASIRNVCRTSWNAMTTSTHHHWNLFSRIVAHALLSAASPILGTPASNRPAGLRADRRGVRPGSGKAAGPTALEFS